MSIPNQITAPLAAAQSYQEQLGQGVGEVEEGDEQVEVFHASIFLSRPGFVEP